MKNLQKAKSSVEKFVADHKVGIAITTTAAISLAVGAKMCRIVVEERDDFLKEHNLLETFYAMFDEE